jgi:hypothetical protein
MASMAISINFYLLRLVAYVIMAYQWLTYRYMTNHNFTSTLTRFPVPGPSLALSHAVAGSIAGIEPVINNTHGIQALSVSLCA